MTFITDDICLDLRDTGSFTDDLRVTSTPDDDLIDWQQRYEGVLVVAYLDGKAVAGISGPWPVNQYALTWWDRPVPARQLELFDSLAAAQHRVEEWAWRMRTIGVLDRAPANDAVLTDGPLPASTRPSWLNKIRELLGKNEAARPQPIARRDIDLLRSAPLNDDDLRGVHFAAIE